MLIQEGLVILAGIIAGVSLPTIITFIGVKIIKKAVNKKVKEIDESTEFKKVHKEIAEVKSILNGMRGKPQ